LKDVTSYDTFVASLTFGLVLRKYETETEGNGNELMEKMLQFNSGGQNKER
jgi:hypothetical protein